MLKTEPQRLLTRVVAGFLGLAAIGLGMSSMLRRGEMFYTNWWGGLVFAPFAVTFGLFIIGCAIFKPSWLAAQSNRKHRKQR